MKMKKFIHDVLAKSYRIWVRTHYTLTRKKYLPTPVRHDMLASHPLVSVVVPVYNTEKKILTDCIESVLNQDYHNVELVLVDDASTMKETTDTLKSYEGNYMQEWKERDPDGYAAAMQEQKRKAFEQANNEAVRTVNLLGRSYDPDIIIADAHHVAELTGDNICSMLADVRRHRPTEIRAINGAIVSMAEKAGFDAPLNRAIVSEVENRFPY